MPSASLQRWFADRAPLLDEIERAHRFIRRSGAGARTATQLINQSYVLMLSAQFQAFCRDLHTECAVAIAAPLVNPDYQVMVLKSLLLNRKLDRGNPNPANIGSDFGRFNITFWALFDGHHPRNPGHKLELEELNEWRNAIAHQDFSASMMRGSQPHLRLAQVRDWRSSCEGLVLSFDDIMRTHIQNLNGYGPW